MAFSTFLMSHQSTIFAGIMDRTTSGIKDIKDASIWVMDAKTQYFDEVKALTDDDVYRVRGVPGVEWAVPLFKGLPRAKAFDGNFRVVVMLGVDDATLVGAPRDMVLGSARGPCANRTRCWWTAWGTNSSFRSSRTNWGRRWS